MKIRFAKWRNSLGVCVSKVSPTRRTFTLEELLVEMTPEAMREAFDWGPDAGCEAID